MSYQPEILIADRWNDRVTIVLLDRTIGDHSRETVDEKWEGRNRMRSDERLDASWLIVAG